MNGVKKTPVTKHAPGKRGAIIRPSQFHRDVKKETVLDYGTMVTTGYISAVTIVPWSSVQVFLFFFKVRDFGHDNQNKMRVTAWMILGFLHPVVGHNYYVACKTPLVLSGHRGFQYQTVLGSGQVKLRRNQDVLDCGSELISGESLGVDVRNTVAGGLCNNLIDDEIGFTLI
jgi:hypothetical protein